MLQSGAIDLSAYPGSTISNWVPELNRHGLRPLRGQIPEKIRRGFSTSRTCEMGLTQYGKVPFRSILYLETNALHQRFHCIPDQ